MPFNGEEEFMCLNNWIKNHFSQKLYLSLFLEGEQIMLERDFQKKFIAKLKALFPGCIILKNNAKYKDSIPDLSFFYKNRYAFFEMKKSFHDYLKSLKNQPNQRYYIDKLNDWSFASYVYPENMKEVIDRLVEEFK